MITLFQKLFRYLLTGTIFLLPFVITVGAVAWLGLFIAQYLGPSTFVGKWLAKIGLFSFQTNYPLLSYIIGLLTVLAIIMAVGWIIERRWVKTCVELLNELIKKIPIIGAFYDAVCQLVSTLDKSKFIAAWSEVSKAFGMTIEYFKRAFSIPVSKLVTFNSSILTHFWNRA